VLEQAGLRDTVQVGWMEHLSSTPRTFTPAFTGNEIEAASAEALDYDNSADDPAHILFTSGSTGEPKGVVITHRNVIRFVEWATGYFGMTESDRVSGHPPLHFDLATFDIFGAFAVGAQLHLVAPQVSLLPNKLAEFIRTSQ